MSPRKGREIPHSLEAEESLLGAMLLSREAVAEAVATLRAEDFYRPAHGHIFDVIAHLHRGGDPTDPVVVADALKRLGLLDEVGGVHVLASLQANAPTTSNAGKYARIIQEQATLRNLLGAVAEIEEQAYSAVDVSEVVRAAQDRIADVVLPIGRVEPGPDILTFLGEEEEADWLIPGMLERLDRAIFTGDEGLGKSTLLRQFALQVAAGIRPFAHREAIEPIRVMLVDCENGANLIRRQMRPMYLKAGQSLDPRLLVVKSRSEGLNLMGRGDRKWLTEHVVANRPDLLVIGPLYRLHDEDPNEEKPARALTAFFDDLRTRYRFSLLIEAHSPQKDSRGSRVLRPVGSSVWLRWPELGIGIQEEVREGRRIYRLKHWRYAREERSWPTTLVRGGEWAWSTPASVKQDDPDNPFKSDTEEDF